jgi:uncharacterized protein (TIGR02246 family)
MAAGSPQDCMTAFEKALVSRDIDAALSLMTDDVVFFYSNGSALAGKKAFADLMTASWKLVANYRYDANNLTWLARSDTAAVVVYAFAWSGVAGGNEVSASGRATRIFRREADGWRVAHEHLSQGSWSPGA